MDYKWLRSIIRYDYLRNDEVTIESNENFT